MKKIFLILSTIVFTGCATTSGNMASSGKNGFDLNSALDSSVNEMQQSGVKPPVINPTVSHQSASPSNNTLTILKLNQDAKPIAQKKINLEAKDDIPFAGGPIVKIQDVPFNGTKVKLVQLMCGNSAIKQKFDNPGLVKGWTTQIDCGNSKYMIIGE